MCRPTVFLDRDGTLNQEVNYLYRPEDLCFLPTVIEAVSLWNQAGFRVAVITNQAGVARGYYQEKDVERLHQYMNRILAEKGAHIDQFYYCPHHPEHGIGPYKRQCHCRKPDIGMFEEAERDEAVDKARSYMIGDKWIDIEAGFRYGVKTALVGTGYGKEMYEAYLEECRKKSGSASGRETEKPKADPEKQAKEQLGYFGDTLLDIAKWILAQTDVK